MTEDNEDQNLCSTCGELIPPNSPFLICPRCCFGSLGKGEDSEELIEGIELGSQIGIGAFGVVYEGLQLDYSMRRVAVKVMKELGFNGAHRARFLEEMQILALLKHPNIAQLFSSGETKEGHPYYAMELVDGLSLNSFLKDHPLETEGVLGLMSQLVDAVTHAHQHGVVHRDLKPANVLISPGTRDLKVIDFGVARILSGPLFLSHEMTQDQRLGTPLYMSPEQFEGDPQIDTRADIYALGLLLYEMTTGGPVLGEVISPEVSWSENARRLERFAFPRIENRELNWIARKACSFEKNSRYQTANEFLGDLRSMQEGRLVAAGQHDWFYRTSKLVKRHRLGLSVLSLLLCLLAVVTGMSWQMGQQEKQAREQILDSMEIAEEARSQALRDASDARLQEANLYLENGDFSEAIGLLNEAISLWDGNLDARYARDFLKATRLFPIRKEVIEIGFPIDRIEETPTGFRVSGSGRKKEIVIEPASYTHPMTDIRVKRQRPGVFEFRSKASGELLLSPLVYGTGREAAAFSLRAGTVASALGDGAIQIWQVSAMRPAAQTWKFSTPVSTVRFESDSNSIWMFDEKIRYSQWKENEDPGEPSQFPGEVADFLESLKTFSRRELIWASDQGSQRATNTSLKSVLTMVQLWGASFKSDWYIAHSQSARDGSQAVFVTSQGEAWVVNKFGLFRKIPESKGEVKRLRISADGKIAALLRPSGEIATLNPRGERMITSWKPPVPCSTLTFADSRNRLLVAVDDGKVRVYHPETGELTGPAIDVSGGLGKVEGLEILAIPHRNEFLTRMDGDLQIKRWNYLTGENLSEGLQHQDGAFWFSCSRDGNFLFSMDQIESNPERSALRIWSLRTGKEIVPALTHHALMNWASIVDNGQRIAITWSDGTVRRWTIPRESDPK